ncbi:protein of unknown function DUF763 [Thermodesulfatator indicus DSM 15286]|uniref:DUF763 domain-containing protein n=1 Tax=Thermodesulfatator indicus (strain DSM 15286 / JCM 11887 / CIR29812) TaxID=667014 RepID=F8A997_THEID|nr:DUF763 domain-containing protein [Thermodesulfatator indicus]AEH45408.1 protein of unknown function DUF763 [Thermodesulfatator indicus DSM 15286]
MAKRTGLAELPLHGGHAPRWLFSRMVRLSKALVEVIVYEFGPEEFLRRMADPHWFQAFGCVLGFDWHSSGLTTTVCGALKEALTPMANDLGIFVCGGKARASRRTPQEIESWLAKKGLPSDYKVLVDYSRLVAKVDNTALQDGYQLYHHTFFFTKKGAWSVVQQGMNQETAYARRYHWLGEEVKSFVNEPHSGIASQRREKKVLNLVAKDSSEVRKVLINLLKEPPEKILKEINSAKKLVFPARHRLSEKDLSPRGLNKVLLKTYERQPNSFEDLLKIEGLGPKSLRALTLVSELIYDVSASREDPAKYSFAHGGKDGIPFPVDTKIYDKTINYIEELLKTARIEYSEKNKAFKRLRKIFN